jgi:HAD superfamily hydrolase (TIGR01509 family)
MPVRAVIFDLGGVLVRTEDKGPRTGLAERFGMTYAEMDHLVFNSPTGAQAALGEISEEEHWRAVCSSLGVPEEEIPAIQEAFWGGDRLDERLVGFIRSMRPGRKTALLSNAWASLRHYLANQWKIIDAFDELFISCELGLAKPDRRVYELVTGRLGVSPAEAVFVDDWLPNIEGAQAAGLLVVHFQNTGQALEELNARLRGERLEDERLKDERLKDEA